MHELVKDYCGNRLKGTADLCASACCDASQMPEWLKPPLEKEGMQRWQNDGLPLTL